MRQDAMTSEKVMLSGWLIAGVVLWLCIGCTQTKKPDRPSQLLSPYPAEKLWAVAPIRNESGTTLVDSFVLADKLVQQLQQVEGIQVLPANRVIAAMQQLDMPALQSVADVMRLAKAMGVDGIVVGTISAWDPYEPPKIGSTIQLYTPGRTDVGTVDPRKLSEAATDQRTLRVKRYEQPVAGASGYFDAANGAVLERIQTYAIGRTPLESPAGWRRYLLSMDLYSEFVMYELSRQLLQAEWDRLTAAPARGDARRFPPSDQP